MEKKTIVTGVIGADAHAVGNKIIAFALEQHNYNVVNLGVMVAQEEYIAAAIETNADAILVSSMYGHGEIDCRASARSATRQAFRAFQSSWAATSWWESRTLRTWRSVSSIWDSQRCILPEQTLKSLSRTSTKYWERKTKRKYLTVFSHCHISHLTFSI